MTDTTGTDVPRRTQSSAQRAGRRARERARVRRLLVSGCLQNNAQRAPGESRAGTQVGDANGIPANRMIDPKLGTRCQDSGLPHKERYCSNQPPVEASARHAQRRRLPPSFAPECGRVQASPARCAACTRCRFGVRAFTGAIRQRFSGRPWSRVLAETGSYSRATRTYPWLHFTLCPTGASNKWLSEHNTLTHAPGCRGAKSSVLALTCCCVHGRRPRDDGGRAAVNHGLGVAEAHGPSRGRGGASGAREPPAPKRQSAALCTLPTGKKNEFCHSFL